MSQRQIDLLPSSYLARSQAGARISQLVATFVIVIAVVITATVHSRYRLKGFERKLQAIEAKSKLVQAAELREADLQQQLSSARTLIARYHLIGYPVQMRHVLATIANALPSSVSLDRLDLNAGERRSIRTARASVKDDKKTSRLLIGEMAGFAASDGEIAELVSNLQQTPPFENISLDFSRHRVVREKGAREFRISFHIDLDQHYQLISPQPAESVARGEEQSLE